jgi:transposase-like protein
VGAPHAGSHYPRSLGEFQAWFATDADCLDFLEWLRWPDGFVCPGCVHVGGWRLADGRFECAECGARSSPPAGTIFDRTRTPLTVWFTACWLFATQKDGISALSLQRALEIGSYQTAWAMLHRVRSVLVRPGRERLRGAVEVDESYIGGEELGLRGGRQKGKKVLVGVAVERIEPRGFGRCRMAPLVDASADSLRAFLTDNVEPGARVLTDGWPSYQPATRELYVHERLVGASRTEASKLLPGVHKVSSLAKRWLLGTHQGAVDEAHLASYLNEFVFRFNRRRSRSRGLVFYRVLELAAAHEPVRYRDLVANHRPSAGPRLPPGTRGRPPSLERPPAGRPWRRRASSG